MKKGTITAVKCVSGSCSEKLSRKDGFFNRLELAVANHRWATRRPPVSLTAMAEGHTKNANGKKIRRSDDRHGA